MREGEGDVADCEEEEVEHEEERSVDNIPDLHSFKSLKQLIIRGSLENLCYIFHVGQVTSSKPVSQDILQGHYSGVEMHNLIYQVHLTLFTTGAFIPNQQKRLHSNISNPTHLPSMHKSARIPLSIQVETLKDVFITHF